MFNMINIGNKISTLRKEKNMTQVELADKIGISYQAVSNWERGNSMPDISKLPELSEIFNVSIDEIIGDNNSVNLIENINNGEIHNYLQQNKVTAEEIIDIAPILKPNQLNDVIDDMKIDLDLGQLIMLAPFIGKETVDKCLLNIIEENSNIEFMKLIVIAPFASKEVMGEVLNYLIKNDNININIKQIVSIAPFVGKDNLDKYIESAFENGIILKTSHLCAIAPFISKDVLSKIALLAYEKTGLDGFMVIAPFMDKEVLTEIVKKEIQKNGFNKTLHRIVPLLPFLKKDIINQWISQSNQSNQSTQSN